MFRNLNPLSLRVSGRQSELIELALTYRFKGLDIDVAHFHKQVVKRGFEHAGRFLESAQLQVGSFSLPFDWHEDEGYQDNLKELGEIAETAAKVGAPVCIAPVLADGSDKPYHENFEFQRQRLSEIAEVLKPHGVKLGVEFSYNPQVQGEATVVNSAEALVTLVNSATSDNLGAVIDLFDWHLSGGTPEMLRELSGARIALVRASDATEEAASTTTDLARQRCLAMKTGVIAADAYANVLRELEFEGPLTPFPHAAQIKGMTRDRIIKAAAESLDRMLGESLMSSPAPESEAVADEQDSGEGAKVGEAKQEVAVSGETKGDA